MLEELHGWGQAVAVVGEADKQMDEAGITRGVEEVNTALLADVIRLPQGDKGAESFEPNALTKGNLWSCSLGGGGKGLVEGDWQG